MVIKKRFGTTSLSSVSRLLSEFQRRFKLMGGWVWFSEDLVVVLTIGGREETYLVLSLCQVSRFLRRFLHRICYLGFGISIACCLVRGFSILVIVRLAVFFPLLWRLVWIISGSIFYLSRSLEFGVIRVGRSLLVHA